MGVPGLFAGYYRKYKKTRELVLDNQQIRNTKIDLLMFDYNSLIHPCAHKVIATFDSNASESEIEEAIITECLSYTRQIISLVSPSAVFIAIDGVAPRSKMVQQRERRYKSCMAPEDSRPLIWDSNKITPGTLFMEKLILRLKATSGYKLSDSNSPGEGEHKMMKYLRDFKGNGGKICIYGLDADLILLSLLHPKANDIILVREIQVSQKHKSDFNGNGSNGSNCVNVSKQEQAFDHINIKTLKGLLTRDFYGSFQESVIDYVYLTFFLGNDFLPKVPLMSVYEDLDTMKSAYTEAKINGSLNLVQVSENGVSIDHRFLTRILKILAHKEAIKIEKHSKGSSIVEVPEDTDQVKYFQQQLWDLKSGVKENKRKYYLYQGLAGSIDDACSNFLTGTVWTMGYYLGHLHDNWSWYYKYDAAPMLDDLYNYISNYTTPYTPIIRKSIPYNQLKQLCLVLPEKSLMVVLEELKQDDSGKVIGDGSTSSDNLRLAFGLIQSSELFPRKINIDLTDKKFLWQGKVVFGGNNIFDLVYDALVLN
jgi:5'-3' exonuclease